MSHPKYKHVGSPMTRLIEECAELQQALCKADRFGWFNFHPDRPERTNMDDVQAEMDDVVEAMERLQEDMRQLRHERFNGSTTEAPNDQVVRPAEGRSEQAGEVVGYEAPDEHESSNMKVTGLAPEKGD